MPNEHILKHVDELYHGRFMARLFKIILEEYPEINNKENIEKVYSMFERAHDKESEWAVELLSDIEGIDLVKLQEFIKLRCNKMLSLMGLNELYSNVDEDPLPWINLKLDNFSDTKSDFFEQKSRQYVKVSTDNGFDDL